MLLNRLRTIRVVRRPFLRSRTTLELENLALRHQIYIFRRSAKKRLALTQADGIEVTTPTPSNASVFWVVLSQIWSQWRAALAIVQPDTVIAWHGKGFRLFWTWKVWRGKPGRAGVPREVRDLIPRMSRENPLWVRLTSMPS